jgi:hypothetical protein
MFVLYNVLCMLSYLQHRSSLLQHTNVAATQEQMDPLCNTTAELYFAVMRKHTKAQCRT